MSGAKMLRYLLYLLAGLLLSLFLAVSLLLYSESGARWLVALADDLTPYEITTKSLQGRLAGPLSLRGLSITDGDLEFKLNVFDFDWRPAELLAGKLHLINVDLKGLAVTPPSAKTDKQAEPSQPFSGLSLPLALQLDRIAVEDVTIRGSEGSEDVNIDQLILSAHSEGKKVNIDHFSLQALSSQLDLVGHLQLSAELPMDLNLDWRHQLDDGPALSGRGEIKGDLSSLRLEQEVDAPLSSHLQAELMNLQTDPQWQANLQLKESELGELIDYPLRLNGNLQSQGKPEAYRFDLSMDVQPHGQPVTKLEASGDGDLKGLQLTTLVANFIEGSLKGTGKLAWDPSVGWQFELSGKNINPANWLRELPGRVDLSLNTQGSMADDALKAEFNLKALESVLRDYPIKAESLVLLDGDTLDVKSLQLDSGKNRVQAVGVVADRLDLDWRIDAPELAAFWPGLEGQLAGEGRLSGPREAPSLKGKLAGQDIRLGANGVKGLKLDADLSLAGEQPISVSLQADGLRNGTQIWQTAALDLKGAIPQHNLTLELSGSDIPQGSAELVAGWSEKEVWSGRLQRLDLKLPEAGDWQLNGETAFSLSAKAQKLDRLCLASEEANLCAEYTSADGEGWEAKGEAKAFPLQVLQPWLPNGLKVNGDLALETHLIAKPGSDPVGELHLQLPEVNLGLDLENEAERVTIQSGQLNASLDAEGANLFMNLPLQGLGEIVANSQLPGLRLDSKEWTQQPVTGRLTLEVKDLSRISLLSPKLQNAKGRIAGDIGVQGSLGSPQVSGGVDLVEASLDIPELGLELREIGVQVKALSQQTLGLAGSLRSGKGRLNLEGKLELDSEAGFPLQLDLKGNELTVANIPEAEVHVTPTIRFERDGKVAKLNGEIHIPFARIRPRALPETAVSNSDDLIIVSADEPTAETRDVPLSAELRIIFGDRVSFDGFGLRGNLTGRLLVIDEPKRPVIGRGRIGIKDGTYRAYGQDLKIERGYALFVDSPVDNPGLDVQAIREVDDVIAGIRVTGTLKKPDIDIFSTPAMSESDVLTYLITGRAPGEGGGQSVGVAAALSATGAGAAAEEVARQFGLDELRVDTGSSLEEASVVAGTYLSPKLYLQYINELASRETKLRIRYDINKRLQLEAETGKSQAGDLFYTFDR